MQIDETPIRSTPPGAQNTTNILMEEKHLHRQSRMEKEKFKNLKDHEFSLSSIFDPTLLRAKGMEVEFDVIFQVVG